MRHAKLIFKDCEQIFLLFWTQENFFCLLGALNKTPPITQCQYPLRRLTWRITFATKNFVFLSKSPSENPPKELWTSKYFKQTFVLRTFTRTEFQWKGFFRSFSTFSPFLASLWDFSPVNQYWFSSSSNWTLWQSRESPFRTSGVSQNWWAP